MHRDQKIGLSLAVLIVGFAGAFCFRNESLSDPEPLVLEQISYLDARIEHLPVRAYVQREGVGIAPEVLRSTDDLVDRAEVETPVIPLAPDEVLSGDLLELYAGAPEPLRTVDPVNPAGATTTEAPSDLEKSMTASAAAPVRTTTEKVTPSVPDEPAVPQESTSRAKHRQSSSGETVRRYVVKSGDTLSGVSLQMYGTCSKYLMIYRANRDVLRDPDDLPVGTTLNIPDLASGTVEGSH